MLRAAQVNKSTSQVDVQVLNLKLDELELASLRGDVQEAALHVNFDTRMGRGAVSVNGPRYSGLQVCDSAKVSIGGLWICRLTSDLCAAMTGTVATVVDLQPSPSAGSQYASLGSRSALTIIIICQRP